VLAYFSGAAAALDLLMLVYASVDFQTWWEFIPFVILIIVWFGPLDWNFVSGQSLWM